MWPANLGQLLLDAFPSCLEFEFTWYARKFPQCMVVSLNNIYWCIPCYLYAVWYASMVQDHARSYIPKILMWYDQILYRNEHFSRIPCSFYSPQCYSSILIHEKSFCPRKPLPSTHHFIKCCKVKPFDAFYEAHLIILLFERGYGESIHFL